MVNLEKARANARKLGVTVRPSTVKGKKLDVFKGDRKVASIGAKGYEDYTTHNDDERKRRYKQRHEKYRHNKGTPSYYADKILWT
ncbi:hypothetical protein AB1Y20_004010 [Prymnesium parvum]|uniref:Uncharacterized protein n=1 Tax=Prymnesium parvum TaxID=97485 RepID=A0AB34J6V9_PRYPA